MSDVPTWTAHTANERIKLLAKLRAQHAELLALFESEIADLEARRDKLVATFAQEEEHILIGLASYYHSNPPVKGKSLALPHGTLSARDNPDSIAIKDAEAAMVWAKANLPDAINAGVDTLYKDPFMAHILKTGEIAPGIELVKGREVFKAVEIGAPPKAKKAPKGEAE